ERAGLRAGDILLAIEGKPVIDSGSMLNLIAALKPNQKATIQIARAGQTISVSILIGKRPKPIVASD
ncbi:MAG: PDZ domain-containing protein, partial [Methylotenera sp.]|nr:PDZ domain-containing protein [Methylotenera sp.]